VWRKWICFDYGILEWMSKKKLLKFVSYIMVCNGSKGILIFFLRCKITNLALYLKKLNNKI